MMDRRTFLSTSFSLAAGVTLSSITGCTPEGENPEQKAARDTIAQNNWAGNLEYRSEQFYQPTSVSRAQEIVAESDRLRPLGTRHCFNRIADSKHAQISLRALNGIEHIDEEASTATIEAGASYGQVCATLDERGFALRNLASLPHISVAGAIATATHGSGADNSNLATEVSGLEFIDARGDLVTLTRENDEFNGVAVHLGGLGLITKVTLDLVPSFDMRQHVYRDLPVPAMRSQFSEIMESGYSVSLFTDYRDEQINQVWRKQKVENSRREPEPDFFGATPAEQKLHPAGAGAAPCTAQHGKPGSWYDRLPHFRMGFTPSSGEELQSEYFVPREHAVDAYDALAEMKDEIVPYLIISEIRLVDADDLWMSTAYGQPKTTFHFTWKPDPEGVRNVLPKIEEALRPFNAQPHWGKVFTMSPEHLRTHYSRLDDFKDLLAAYDPDGKFRNQYMQRYFYDA